MIQAPENPDGTLAEQMASIQASLKGPALPWPESSKTAAVDQPLPEVFLGTPVLTIEELQAKLQATAARFRGSAKGR